MTTIVSNWELYSTDATTATTATTTTATTTATTITAATTNVTRPIWLICVYISLSQVTLSYIKNRLHVSTYNNCHHHISLYMKIWLLFVVDTKSQVS